MSSLKDDFKLLLKVDQVYRPKTAAKKFAYSEELAKIVKSGTFFECYKLESDERFFINDIATYFEMLGMLYRKKIVDQNLALEWSGAQFYWHLIGPILVQAREVFNSQSLWEDFEYIAKAQTESSM